MSTEDRVSYVDGWAHKKCDLEARVEYNTEKPEFKSIKQMLLHQMFAASVVLANIPVLIFWILPVFVVLNLISQIIYTIGGLFALPLEFWGNAEFPMLFFGITFIAMIYLIATLVVASSDGKSINQQSITTNEEDDRWLVRIEILFTATIVGLISSIMLIIIGLVFYLI